MKVKIDNYFKFSETVMIKKTIGFNIMCILILLF